MAKKTLIERMLSKTKADKTALAAEALIEAIEHMNSPAGAHWAHYPLMRKSVESKVVLKALRQMRGVDSTRHREGK